MKARLPSKRWAFKFGEGGPDHLLDFLYRCVTSDAMGEIARRLHKDFDSAFVDIQEAAHERLLIDIPVFPSLPIDVVYTSGHKTDADEVMYAIYSRVRRSIVDDMFDIIKKETGLDLRDKWKSECLNAKNRLVKSREEEMEKLKEEKPMKKNCKKGR